MVARAGCPESARAKERPGGRTSANSGVSPTRRVIAKASSRPPSADVPDGLDGLADRVLAAEREDDGLQAADVREQVPATPRRQHGEDRSPSAPGAGGRGGGKRDREHREDGGPVALVGDGTGGGERVGEQVPLQTGCQGGEGLSTPALLRDGPGGGERVGEQCLR